MMKEQIQKIHDDIFRKRLSPTKDCDSSKWEYIYIRLIKPNIDQKIEDLLKEGKTVKGGYFCTSVRGFHNYVLMVKK